MKHGVGSRRPRTYIPDSPSRLKGIHLPNEYRFKMTNDSRFEILSDLSQVSLRLYSENYRFEMTPEELSFRNDRPVFRFEMIDSDRHFEMIRIDYFLIIL